MIKCLRLTVSIGVLAASLLAASAASADAPTPARLYKKHCAICHAKDGSGKTKQGEKTKTADWTDGSIWTRVDDETAKRIIVEGKGKMKAYDKKVPADQVDALLAYCKGLSQPPPAAAPAPAVPAPAAPDAAAPAPADPPAAE